MMKRLFKGGTVVSGEGLKKIDLLVKGEKILAAGKNLEFQDAETIDVRGKLLFPGFIDAHTHMAAKFNDITAADKFETGTKAALAGGTTCIIDFAEQKKGKSLKEAIDDKRQEAEGEASCDYALHLTLNEWNDDVAEELGEIVKKETCSFKLYTAYDMMLDDGQIYEIFSRVKELGGIVGVHCENHGIVQSRLKELEKTKGRTDIVGCIERRKDSDDSVRSFWIYKRTEKCRRRGFYADAFRYAGSRRTSGAYVAVRSE